MPAFRTDRRKTDRLDDRAPLPGSDFLVGVDRRPPADAHEVVEVVDLIGGLTGELGRASVRTPDERGVDPGVVGGEHVRLVVADENRGLGAEVFEGALDVVRRRLLPREAGDGGLTAVCDLEPPGEPEVVEDRVDGCLLVRGDDPERGVEMAERVDIVVGVFRPFRAASTCAPRRSRREPARTRPGRARSARRYPSE